MHDCVGHSVFVMLDHDHVVGQRVFSGCSQNHLKEPFARLAITPTGVCTHVYLGIVGQGGRTGNSWSRPVQGSAKVCMWFLRVCVQVTRRADSCLKAFDYHCFCMILPVTSMAEIAGQSLFSWASASILGQSCSPCLCHLGVGRCEPIWSFSVVMPLLFVQIQRNIRDVSQKGCKTTARETVYSLDERQAEQQSSMRREGNRALVGV